MKLTNVARLTAKKRMHMTNMPILLKESLQTLKNNK